MATGHRVIRSPVTLLHLHVAIVSLYQVNPHLGTEPWCSQLSRSLLYFRHFSSSNIGSYGRRIGITMNTFRIRRHRHSRRKPAFSKAHSVVLKALLLWPNEMSSERMNSRRSLIYTSFLIQEVHLKCYAPWDSFSTSAQTEEESLRGKEE